MNMRKKNKNNKNYLYKILSILLILISVAFIGIILYIDLLPFKHLIVIVASILFFDTFNVFLISLKRLKRKIKKALAAFMILAILVMSAASFYMLRTVNVLLGNGDSKYKIESYSVMVLKDSSYNEIEDIEDETVGYFKNSKGSESANKELLDKVNIELEAYDSSDSLIHDLLDKKTNVIVLEDSVKNIMQEEIDNFEDSIKVIYTFKIKVEVESTLKEAEVTKEPFAIYISGIDTYGEISSVSRSDVNIVMVVNPKTHQVLLISIPRDYYVQLHGTTGTRDKLTHAGIYGVDMSIQTIEDLLDIDINYYVKVNFTSVIDIVDALGGLDVYSEYTFVSYSGFNFTKGMNSVNGEQALDFARTRKAFSNGDRQRGINQQAVIEALIRKASSKTIITKYNSLLNAIDGKYQTNMSMKKITSLIKMQLNDMPTWTVNSYSLTGSDANDYTYTYNQLLYVMKPDEESIEEAKSLIQSILNNDELDNSYENLIDGNSKKVTKNYNSTSSNSTNTPKTTETNVKKDESNIEDTKTSPNKENNKEEKKLDNKTDDNEKTSNENESDDTNSGNNNSGDDNTNNNTDDDKDKNENSSDPIDVITPQDSEKSNN